MSGRAQWHGIILGEPKDCRTDWRRIPNLVYILAYCLAHRHSAGLSARKCSKLHASIALSTPTDSKEALDRLRHRSHRPIMKALPLTRKAENELGKADYEEL